MVVLGMTTAEFSALDSHCLDCSHSYCYHYLHYWYLYYYCYSVWLTFLFSVVYFVKTFYLSTVLDYLEFVFFLSE
jgi:hypothetical protein